MTAGPGHGHGHGHGGPAPSPSLRPGRHRDETRPAAGRAVMVSLAGFLAVLGDHHDQSYRAAVTVTVGRRLPAAASTVTVTVAAGPGHVT